MTAKAGSTPIPSPDDIRRRLRLDPAEAQQIETTLLTALVSRELPEVLSILDEVERREIPFVLWYCKTFNIPHIAELALSIATWSPSEKGRGRDQVVEAIRFGKKIRRRGILGTEEEIE